MSQSAMDDYCGRLPSLSEVEFRVIENGHVDHDFVIAAYTAIFPPTAIRMQEAQAA